MPFSVQRRQINCALYLTAAAQKGVSINAVHRGPDFTYQQDVGGPTYVDFGRSGTPLSVMYRPCITK